MTEENKKVSGEIKSESRSRTVERLFETLKNYEKDGDKITNLVVTLEGSVGRYDLELNFRR